MSSLALYRKYRPQSFEDVLGQEHVSKTLQAAIKEGRIAHAFLFSGSRGTGKTSTARILAKALNCEKGPTPTPCNVCDTCRSITDGSSLDVIEIDAASHGGVEDVRDLRENALLAPAIARRKIYIVDEAHMVSSQGWNAFLKTVEEPPEHVIFVFATTEPHKVLPTILSRCQRFDFRRVSSSTIAEHLAKVSAEEGIPADDAALQLIARAAEGGVRDALSTLDQLASTGSVTVEDAARLLGTTTGDILFEFTDAIAAGSTALAVQTLARVVEEGQDLRVFGRNLLDHLRALLIVKQVPEPGDLIDATDETRARLAGQAEAITIARLVHTLRLFSDALSEIRQQAAPRLTLELATVRAAMPEVDESATAALSRIERLERLLELGGKTATKTEPAAPVPAKDAAPKRAAAAKPAAREKGSRKEPDPPAPPKPKPAAGAVDLEMVRRSWPVVLEEVRKSGPRLHALVSDATPVELEDGVLSLTARSNWHAEQICDAGNAGKIAAAIETVLGLAPRLKAEARAPAPEPTDEYEDARGSEPAADPLDIVRSGFGDDVQVEE